MEGTASQRSQTFIHEGCLAVHQSRQFSPVLRRATGHRIDVRLVVLADISGVRARHGPLVTHPGHGHRSVQTTGEGDADALADGQGGEDLGHEDHPRGQQEPARYHPPHKGA